VLAFRNASIENSILVVIDAKELRRSRTKSPITIEVRSSVAASQRAEKVRKRQRCRFEAPSLKTLN